jgi:hypothetical protein
VLNALDHFADKGLRQHGAGLGFGNAALAGVEDRVLVQGADGVAVGAGDVVGEDQQLGLGVDLGLVRQDQGVVAHAGVGLVGAGLDDDPALEHAARLVVDHALGQLAGGPVDAAVGDLGGLVGVALAVQQVDAVEPHLGVGAGMGDAGLDPLATGAGGQDGLGVGRAGSQGDLGGRRQLMASAVSTSTMRSTTAPLATAMSRATSET